jgi:dTDP-3-amino-2,3,6-trideoxy-4-keto-D-glucose/dTDP-3-amino-3,4,6-trideoxy-alpha-D-glucose/dTDP-2,6-dideoxy-D-kanosamine transaminase
MEIVNFLPEQYEQDSLLGINHNYLQQQFSDCDVILEKIKQVVLSGDFTLGRAVDEFEERFKTVERAKHAIGVGSGTDALFLSLKALGIKEGDEVITTPFTFYATIGAIVTAGAKPVFVDVKADYNIDPAQIENKITSKTKAILPVHWAGKPCDMDAINAIAKKHQLYVVEDACHAIQATYRGRSAGTLGDIGCFSFHPLKNLNVWGDGGIITTNDDKLAEQLRLMRNHGLKGRDECLRFAYNSRLDTIQAVVGGHLLDKMDHITQSRIQNAAHFDKHLSSVSQIIIPERESYIQQVYHLYSVRCEKRDELKAYLIAHGVDAKIHYPVPMHLQPAADSLKHKKGDFPMAETISDSTLSLPVHEFIAQEHLDKVIHLVKEFYR